MSATGRRSCIVCQWLIVRLVHPQRNQERQAEWRRDAETRRRERLDGVGHSYDGGAMGTKAGAACGCTIFALYILFVHGECSHSTKVKTVGWYSHVWHLDTMMGGVAKKALKAQMLPPLPQKLQKQFEV